MRSRRAPAHLIVPGLITLIGLSGAFAAGCADEPAVAPDTTIISQAALRDDMRALWIDHVTWTRIYLMSAIAGLPDTNAASARLLQNQVEIGDAIKPFYGDAAGDALAALLHDHITIAAEAVTAAKGGDTAGLDDAKARWTANADQIATFLAAANPNWPLADLKMMMRMHLDQTLAEASARLTADWAGDIAAYDTIVDHILQMADVLADGIGKQFPDRVSPAAAASADTDALHLAMRDLWADHVTWTRVFLVSAIAGLPDADAAAARLLQNQVDIGDAMRPLYGEAAGDGLTALLHDHITIAAEIVTLAKADDATGLAEAKTRWTKNADDIAAFLASANPNWALADLKTMMRMHLDQTLTEATARLTADWPGDVAAYDAIVGHILQMADALSAGITRQFGPHLLR